MIAISANFVVRLDGRYWRILGRKVDHDGIGRIVRVRRVRKSELCRAGGRHVKSVVLLSFFTFKK